MDSANSEIIIIILSSYLLTAFSLLAYKAALNDLYAKNLKRIWWEIKAVHPISLLAGFVSLIPFALIDQDNSDSLKYGILGGVVAYFISTLVYRHIRNLKVLDFSIDTGSSFNDEISADPTAAQKIWLFLVSWAGAILYGLIFGLVVSYNSWKDQTNWLSDRPGDYESNVYLYIFGGAMIVSAGLFVFLHNRSFKRLPTAHRLRAAINRSWFLPSMLGFFFALVQAYTRNDLFANRYFTVVVFALMLTITLWNFIFVVPNSRKHLKEDRQFFDAQRKRLRKQKNKKRKKRH